MVQQNRQYLMTKGYTNSFMNSANVRYHIQHKQQLNQRTQRPQQKQMKGQDLAKFNSAVQELCSMYDAVNYFGKAEYARKNGWRVINKEQLNTATIYAIRYAPVVPKRSARQQKPQQRQQKPQPKQQQQLRQQPKRQLKQQPKEQQRQQPRQQNNKRQGGRRIGGCPYKPNVPRTYPYNTAPLPSNLYPTVNNFNHLYDAFNYFGNSQVRNIKSWIESSRTHKLSSIASVFAKRNAPYVPVRHNRSNKRNQHFQKRPQQFQRNAQIQRNAPKQQSNKRQRNNQQKKRLMINQQPLSNVWEEYYVSPKRRMFK